MVAALARRAARCRPSWKHPRPAGQPAGRAGRVGGGRPCWPGPGRCPVLDPGQGRGCAPAAVAAAIAGLAGREDWYFVGGGREQRHWPGRADRPPGGAGIVICGIGGAGKTTLAAEITARVRDRDPGRILVSLAGPLTLEGLLGAMVTTVRRELLIRGQVPRHRETIRALDAAGRADLGWQDRLCSPARPCPGPGAGAGAAGQLRGQPAPRRARLDAVADEALGGLLAAWAVGSGAARLLVTCRYRFTLPGGAERFLSFRQLAALSRAETMKLAWSLPALDKLDQAQLEQVWRLAGGHPRSLEYLDALLSGGIGPLPRRHRAAAPAITGRLEGDDLDQWLAARTGLDAALAETVALAANDVLLGDLLARLAAVPGAAGLLRRGLGLPGAGRRQRGAVPGWAARPCRRARPGPRSGLRAGQWDPGRGWDPPGDPPDLAALPATVRQQLAPHLAELARRPSPPYRPRPGLDDQAAACHAGQPANTASDGEQRLLRAPVDSHRTGRPRRRGAGPGAPAGGRLLAVAGPGVATGQGG